MFHFCNDSAKARSHDKSCCNIRHSPHKSKGNFNHQQIFPILNLDKITHRMDGVYPYYLQRSMVLGCAVVGKLPCLGKDSYRSR